MASGTSHVLLALEVGYSLPALLHNPLLPLLHIISDSCILLEKHHAPSWGQLIISGKNEPKKKKCWLLSLNYLMGKSQVASQHCPTSPVCSSSQITVPVSEKAHFPITSSLDFHHPSPFLVSSSWSCFLFTKETKPFRKYLLGPLTGKSLSWLIPTCSFFLPI